jgi:hypothetical protein
LRRSPLCGGRYEFLFRWFFLLGIPLLQASEVPGIKLTIERGSAGNMRSQTIYLQADRKQMEYRNSFGQRKADGSIQPVYGPHIRAITRCDLGQSFELNLDTGEYESVPYPPMPFTREEMKARGLDTPVTYVSDKPTLRIEVTTTDTGERREIFGHMARHVITTRKQIPLEGSPSQPQESVTDGWYIDSESGGIDLNRLSCDRKWPAGKRGRAYLRAGNRKQPIDRAEFVDIGEPETGFALSSVTTSKNAYTLPDGTVKHSETKLETKVTELEEGRLDPAIFEIPPGFKQVEHIEKSPPASAFADLSSATGLWQRIKESVAGLFSR